MMMLGPGFSAQCDVLMRTCVGRVIDGIGKVDRDRTLDGKPISECVHALIVVVVSMLSVRKAVQYPLECGTKQCCCDVQRVSVMKLPHRRATFQYGAWSS